MSRAQRIVFGVASALFGAMWFVAAGWKVLAPLPAYEFVARVLPPGPVAKSALVAAIAVEALLGAMLVLRGIGHVLGYVLSLVGLATVSGVLLYARAVGGGLMPCGCYGDAILATVDDELVRDAVAGAVLVALIAWGWWTKRLQASGARSQEGFVPEA